MSAFGCLKRSLASFRYRRRERVNEFNELRIKISAHRFPGQPVRVRQSWPWMAMLHDGQLLAKHEVLKSQLALGTKRRSKCSNDDPQPLQHGLRLAGSPRKETIESSRTNKWEGQALRRGDKIFTGLILINNYCRS